MVKAFVTGGTGFLGGHLARKLRDRGDEVVALVRWPERAGALAEIGCRLVEGNLTDAVGLRSSIDGCDAVFHCAAVYRVGIPAGERPAMLEANVRGTECVLDAGTRAGVARIVYVSTNNVLGNTRGEVVDETYQRVGSDYLSYYDETKFRAHQVAMALIGKGAPILIAQPGAIYGPGDHSEVGSEIERMRRGKLRFLSFPELGFNFGHVEDVADGILLVHDRGRIGETYILGGEITTLGEVIRRVARLTGRKTPMAMPSSLIRLSTPLAPLVTRVMGLPPNLGEIVRAADGVTYWGSDGRARRELGYSPRGIETGLRDLLSA